MGILMSILSVYRRNGGGYLLSPGPMTAGEAGACCPSVVGIGVIETEALGTDLAAEVTSQLRDSTYAVVSAASFEDSRPAMATWKAAIKVSAKQHRYVSLVGPVEPEGAAALVAQALASAEYEGWPLGTPYGESHRHRPVKPVHAKQPTVRQYDRDTRRFVRT